MGICFFLLRKTVLRRTWCSSWDARQDPGFVRSIPQERAGGAQSSGLYLDCSFGSGKSFPDALAMPGPAGLCSRGLLGRWHLQQTPSSDISGALVCQHCAAQGIQNHSGAAGRARWAAVTQLYLSHLHNHINLCGITISGEKPCRCLQPELTSICVKN